MTTLIEWYPPEIKPVRVGEYEVKSWGYLLIAVWSGREWRDSKSCLILSYQHVVWRGLAADPKVTK